MHSKSLFISITAAVTLAVVLLILQAAMLLSWRQAPPLTLLTAAGGCLLIYVICAAFLLFRSRARLQAWTQSHEQLAAADATTGFKIALLNEALNCMTGEKEAEEETEYPAEDTSSESRDGLQMAYYRYITEPLRHSYAGLLPLGKRKFAVYSLKIIGGKKTAQLAQALHRCLSRADEIMPEFPFEEADRAMYLLNEMVTGQVPEDEFINMIYGVIDLPHSEIIWANAGHLNPMQSTTTRPAQMIELSYGMSLGVVPQQTYSANAQSFRKGHTLILFNDGLLDTIKPTNHGEAEEVMMNHHDPLPDDITTCCNDISRLAAKYRDPLKPEFEFDYLVLRYD